MPAPTHAQRPILRLIFGSMLAIASGPVIGVEVYRWIDENGVVHFSDSRPADAPAVTTIELAELDASDYDPADDPYSVMNQARRIHARWLELVGSRRERASRRETQSDDAGAPSRQRQHVSTYWVVPTHTGPRPSGNAAQQLRALEQLDLLGPRSPSINSGTHRERVIRSQFLPGITMRDRSGR